MKRRILQKAASLSILIFLLLPLHVRAQVKLGIGAAVTPQWCYMTYIRSYIDRYDGNSKAYFLTGVGLHTDLQFARWISLETGVYYCPKGSILKEEPEMKLRMNYINIPVVIRLAVPVTKALTLDYLFGVYKLKLLNHKVNGLDMHDDDLFQKSTTSFVLGHGVTYDLDETWSLFSSFRFDFSLNKVETHTESVPGYNLGVTKHMAYGVFVGVKASIPLSKKKVPPPKKGKELKLPKQKATRERTH